MSKTYYKIITICIAIIYILNISSISVFANSDPMVYISGMSIVTNMTMHNLIVLQKPSVSGAKDFKRFDILKAIRYKKGNEYIVKYVQTTDDLQFLYEKDSDYEVDVLIKRDGELKSIKTDVFNIVSNVWQKNLTSCGTLTFVTEDKKHFGAYGHSGFKTHHIDLEDGETKVYASERTYINKNEGGTLGIQKIEGLKYIGYLTDDTTTGVHGVIENYDSIKLIDNDLHRVGTLDDVEDNQKAYICYQSPKTQKPRQLAVEIKGKTGLPVLSTLDKSIKTTFPLYYKHYTNDEVDKIINGFSGSPILLEDGTWVGATSLAIGLFTKKETVKPYIGGVDSTKMFNKENVDSDNH